MIETSGIQKTEDIVIDKNNILLSIIIPAFNEGRNIGVVLTDLFDNVGNYLFPTEIIVVDDGSMDDTNEIAQKYDVTILNNERNLGKTQALLNGIAKTNGNIIITMDADGSHLAKDVNDLINPVINNEADFTIGSRFIKEEGRKSTTKLHLIGNKIINTAIYLMTGKNVSDSQSGFRAYKKDILTGVEIKSRNFEIETEITIRLIMNGYKQRDVPINCMPRLNGKTKLRTFRDGAAIIFTVLRTAVDEYYKKLGRGK